MSEQIPLHELNQHLFADLLPATHGADVKPAAAPGKKAGKGKSAAAAPEYTAEQLEILAAAGIADPATAEQQTVAAILGL